MRPSSAEARASRWRVALMKKRRREGREGMWIAAREGRGVEEEEGVAGRRVVAGWGG